MRLAFFLFVPISLVAAAASEPMPSLWPTQVAQGQLALLKWEPSQAVSAESVRAHFAEQEIKFWKCGPAASTAVCALVAVPLETALGSHEVEVNAVPNQLPQGSKLAIKVIKGKFKVNHLKVEPKQTNPSEAEKQRMEADRNEIKAATAASTPVPFWSESFVAPTALKVTSGFGNQRKYNTDVKSTHYGVDLRANEKTPIFAINAAKVVLAHEFFVAGNMVLLDHGGGIFSSYSHLSTLEVKAGEEVKKGQKIGMAGGTGRATGPHLHWATRVNGHPVDPLAFLRIVNKNFSKKSR